MTSFTAGRIVFAVAALASIVAAGSCRKSQGVQCDTATETIFCAGGTHCAAKTAQCITGLCGNGIREAGEACDDGGTRNNDVIDNVTCNANCTSDETCGNGFLDLTTNPPEVCDCKVDPVTGEKQCQPADATNCVLTGTNRCLSTGECGNNNPDPGEYCDPGTNGVPLETAECDLDCSKPEHGDGRVNTHFEEACDRNNDNIPGDGDGDGAIDCQSPTCNIRCQVSRCGDHVTNPLDKRGGDPQGRGEQCDEGDGNNRVHATCNSHCIWNVCGDNDRNETNVGGRPVEDCDTGPADISVKTDCQYATAPYSGCPLCSNCKSVWGTPHYCGDGHTDTGREACDRGDKNGTDDARKREFCIYNRTCELCTTTCTVASIAAPKCGDGKENEAWLPDNGGWYDEDCDNVIAQTCGTCGAIGAPNECKFVDRAGAHGRITVVSNDLLEVTFAFAWDETKDDTVFEYVAPGGTVTHTGAIPIEIGATMNDTVNNTVNVVGNVRLSGAPTVVGTTFEARREGNVVIITNKAAGIKGNVPITLDPADTTALQADVMMTGGVGCGEYQTCRGDFDCFEAAYRCVSSGSSKQCKPK